MDLKIIWQKISGYGWYEGIPAARDGGNIKT